MASIVGKGGGKASGAGKASSPMFRTAPSRSKAVPNSVHQTKTVLEEPIIFDKAEG